MNYQTINLINKSLNNEFSNKDNQIDTTGRINQKLLKKFNKSDIIKLNDASISTDNNIYSSLNIDNKFNNFVKKDEKDTVLLNNSNNKFNASEVKISIEDTYNKYYYTSNNDKYTLKGNLMKINDIYYGSFYDEDENITDIKIKYKFCCINENNEFSFVKDENNNDIYSYCFDYDKNNQWFYIGCYIPNASFPYIKVFDIKAQTVIRNISLESINSSDFNVNYYIIKNIKYLLDESLFVYIGAPMKWNSETPKEFMTVLYHFNLYYLDDEYNKIYITSIYNNNNSYYKKFLLRFHIEDYNNESMISELKNNEFNNIIPQIKISDTFINIIFDDNMYPIPLFTNLIFVSNYSDYWSDGTIDEQDSPIPSYNYYIITRTMQPYEALTTSPNNESLFIMVNDTRYYIQYNSLNSNILLKTQYKFNDEQNKQISNILCDNNIIYLCDKNKNISKYSINNNITSINQILINDPLYDETIFNISLVKTYNIPKINNYNVINLQKINNNIYFTTNNKNKIYYIENDNINIIDLYLNPEEQINNIIQIDDKNYILFLNNKDYFINSFILNSSTIFNNDNSIINNNLVITQTSASINSSPINNNDLVNKKYVDDNIFNVNDTLHLYNEKSLITDGSIETKSINIDNNKINNSLNINETKIRNNFRSKIYLSKDKTKLFYFDMLSSQDYFIYFNEFKDNTILNTYKIGYYIDNTLQFLNSFFLIDNYIIFQSLSNNISKKIFVYFDYTLLDLSLVDENNILKINYEDIDNEGIIKQIIINDFDYIIDKTFKNDNKSVFQIIQDNYNNTLNFNQYHLYVFNNELYFIITSSNSEKDLYVICKIDFIYNKIKIINYIEINKLGVNYDFEAFVVYYYNNKMYCLLGTSQLYTSYNNLYYLINDNNFRYTYFKSTSGLNITFLCNNSTYITNNNKCYIIDISTNKKYFDININDNNEITINSHNINNKYNGFEFDDKYLYFSYKDTTSNKYIIDKFDVVNNKIIYNVLSFNNNVNNNNDNNKLSFTQNVFITYDNTIPKIYLKSYDYIIINNEQLLYKNFIINDNKTIINNKLELFEGTIRTEPINDNDIVYKKYVDEQVNSIQSNNYVGPFSIKWRPSGQYTDPQPEETINYPFCVAYFYNNYCIINAPNIEPP